MWIRDLHVNLAGEMVLNCGGTLIDGEGDVIISQSAREGERDL